MHQRRHGHAPDSPDYLPAAGYDALLPAYDLISRLLGAAKLHRRLVELADLHPGQRVLEIGCGTGNLTKLVKRGQPGAEVVGLDPDPRALAMATRKAAGLGVRFDRGYSQSLPYPDGSFDRVLSSLMFHHLDEEQKRGTLSEVRRVLRPGGALYLVDFGAESGGHGLLRRRRPHRIVGNDAGTLTRLCAEAGFGAVAELERARTRIGAVSYYRGIA
jgi:ubiquinone/menaquinone biosynthesis C-methylase UbiE